MQIVFFGAGKIAALLLQRLSEAHDMMLTVTPPRTTGRTKNDKTTVSGRRLRYTT